MTKEHHSPETEDTSACHGTGEDKGWVKRGHCCPFCGEPIEMDLDGFGWCENVNCPWPRGERSE